MKKVKESLSEFLNEEISRESYVAFTNWETAVKNNGKLKISFTDTQKNENGEMDIEILKKYDNFCFVKLINATSSEKLNLYINDKIILDGLPTQIGGYFKVLNERRDKRIADLKLINIQTIKNN
jgi:hypothetical protein